MKERDFKFNKTIKFSLSVANLRNQAILYGSLNIYLNYFVRTHSLILKSVLKLEKVAFSPRQHILNCLVTYSLKTDCSVQKFNDCSVQMFNECFII